MSPGSRRTSEASKTLASFASSGGVGTAADDSLRASRLEVEAVRELDRTGPPRPPRPPLPPFPPIADALDTSAFLPAFDAALVDGPLDINASLDQAEVREMYRTCQVWLDGPLAECLTSSRPGAPAWRELQLAVGSTTGTPKGECMTGGLILKLSHAPPSLPAKGARMPKLAPCAGDSAGSSSSRPSTARSGENAAGFTLTFLSKLLSAWGCPGGGPGPHFEVDLRCGDILRVLVSQQGWCDVAACSPPEKRWTPLASWQTTLRAEPVYVGLGLKHTLTARLCRVRSGVTVEFARQHSQPVDDA